LPFAHEGYIEDTKDHNLAGPNSSTEHWCVDSNRMRNSKTIVSTEFVVGSASHLLTNSSGGIQVTRKGSIEETEKRTFRAPWDRKSLLISGCTV
jgi:hypothetical protein